MANGDPPRITTQKSIDKAYALLNSCRPQEKAPRKKFTKPPAVLTPEAQAKKRKQTIWNMKKNRLTKALVCDFNLRRLRQPWLEYTAMEQLRYAMGRHDWAAVIRLFPYCGQNQRYYQPIRFTYAFLLFLCSHVSDETQFQHFLETCIGPGAVEGAMLQKLMTLQLRRKFV